MPWVKLGQTWFLDMHTWFQLAIWWCLSVTLWVGPGQLDGSGFVGRGKVSLLGCWQWLFFKRQKMIFLVRMLAVMPFLFFLPAREKGKIVQLIQKKWKKNSYAEGRRLKAKVSPSKVDMLRPVLIRFHFVWVLKGWSGLVFLETLFSWSSNILLIHLVTFYVIFEWWKKF